MAYITITERQQRIEAQAAQYKRRADRLRDDHNYLTTELLNNPRKDMKAQYALLQEWDHEIELIEIRIQELRDEWRSLDKHHSTNIKKVRS